MIWDIKAVKKACNEVLSAAFNGAVPVYGNDTLDGYDRPGFFTEILSSPRTKPGRFLTQQTYTFVITYFEETHDEAHCYDVYNTICGAFGGFVKIASGKKLVISNINMSWIDENADMLQVTIGFSPAAELGGNTETAALMENIDIKTESEVI